MTRTLRPGFVGAIPQWWSLCLALLLPVTVSAGEALDPWRGRVCVQPVTETAERHVIHSYYLTCPESPDGTQILFYTSRTPEGEHGDLVIRDRATGRERVVAQGLNTEDAHRVACQQWVSAGRRVAYHDVKEGRWSVHVIDLASGRDRVMATDRQLGLAPAWSDIVPLYGCHWHPGAHRDLELLNAADGTIAPSVAIASVEKHYGDWLQYEFGGLPTSVFFPVISPDGERVFFKLAAPGPDGARGDYRSPQASHRQGTVVAVLDTQALIFMRPTWGHPAWHPDSRHLLEVHSQLLDTTSGGRGSPIPGLPDLPGEHPSVSPDGRLLVKDGPLGTLGAFPGEWGVLVCDIKGGAWQLIHRFDNTRGATSWRCNHPHPVFSADGKRIYFNVNSGRFTQLFVAEAP